MAGIVGISLFILCLGTSNSPLTAMFLGIIGYIIIKTLT